MTPPRATYRLQLRPDFGFAAARRLTPYLRRLGISHVYASPIFHARRGSTHGYDITDHRAISDELGGEEAFTAWARDLEAAGLGLIIDFVPNHMGVGRDDNPWWLDVLEWGRRSRFADAFDIDWEPAKPALSGKVLVPMLGDHYGAVLERGEIVVRFDADEGSFSAHYYEHRFPLTPSTYPQVFRESSRVPELDALLAELRGLDRPDADAVLGGRLFDHVAELKARLAALARDEASVRDEIARAVAWLAQGEARARQDLHALLERQCYRLAFFRVAADEINYRRFFNINELAGVRVELSEIYQVVHEKVDALVASGLVAGLRIDHVDGLFDPAGYCRRLRQSARDRGRDIYLVVEKILAEHEALREDWEVDGTTGYDFLGEVVGLFVDPRAEGPLRTLYRRQTGDPLDLEEAFHRAKRYTIDHQLSAELLVLANMLERIAERNPWTRDFTLPALRQALRMVVASFPVYRTYVAPDHPAGDDDRRDIVWAVARARKRLSSVDHSVFDFIEKAMLGELGTSLSSGYDPLEAMRFAMKLQQYTGPVMAKAIEDTAFYRHPLLLALADVGADPRHFGSTVGAFHRRQERRAKRFPASMLATSTHDTKRGEDARARIAVLSEMAPAWSERVAHWNKLNRSRRAIVDDQRAPDGRDIYLVYQSLVGSWPVELVGEVSPDPAAMAAFTDRFVAYAIKALREGKTRSSWDAPQVAYEEAMERYLRRILAVGRPNKFLDDFIPFQARIAELGVVNSLSQLVLRLTAPGLPDTYQGSELWDLSLVDPDNRRPIDYAARSRALEEVEGAGGETVSSLLAGWKDARIKLFILQRLLRLRADHPELFAEGDYQPLFVDGRYDDHLVAFERRHASGCLLVAVPRLVAGLAAPGHWPLAEAWRNTAVGPEREASWRDVLTGEAKPPESRLLVASLFRRLPLAVLIEEPEGAS